jgi:hypothetical protein
MTHTTRRILFFSSIIIFILISIPLLFYTFGYRFSFQDRSLRQTGGIFVHANPIGSLVSINAVQKTTSYLTGNAFIQNLKPGNHTITVTKNGFQSWKKTITIDPQNVTEVYPLLMPLSSDIKTVNIASSTLLYPHSTNSSLMLLRVADTTKTSLNFFDVNLAKITPYANEQSHSVINSISIENIRSWNTTQDYILLETKTDWIELNYEEDDTISARSLYKASALSKQLAQKPISIQRHPYDAQTYFILDGTNFSRWSEFTGTFQQLLQSIAGFTIFEQNIILWNTQNGLPYKITLEISNAQSLATTSIPDIQQAVLKQNNTSLVILANNGLWIATNELQRLQLLTDVYDPQRVLVTDTYVLWWNDSEIYIYWTLPVDDLPVFQNTRQETLYASSGILHNITPYPDEPYLIIQEDSVLYSLELDGRNSSDRNRHIIYKGLHPTFHVASKERVLYILDNSILYTLDLP